MTETVLQISPEVFWGLVSFGGFLAACLLVFSILTVMQQNKIEVLSNLQKQLGLEGLPLALFCIATLLWSTVFLFLFFGLIWTIGGFVWPEHRTNDPASWQWRFELVKLTALTATLAAVVAFPITMQRLRLTEIQTSTASEALFSDKINAAANDLHSQRQVTINVEDTNNRADIWQDDIVRRNMAINQLERLVQERPNAAPHIARMLSTYVRELSKEFSPSPMPEDDSLAVLRLWASSLKPCRPDMENAVQTLGRLQTIKDVDSDSVKIDLRGANLQGFDLRHAVLKSARLGGAHLQGAQLYHAKMQHCNLSRTQMQGASFEFAQLQRAILFEAEMQVANLTGANLKDTSLEQANMQSVILRHTEMQGAQLFATILRGASFRKTEMDARTSLFMADLHGAMIQGCNFSDVEFANVESSEIFYDGSTKFSDKLIPTKGRDKVLGHKFASEWREWQKSIGFDPDTYQA